MNVLEDGPKRVDAALGEVLDRVAQRTDTDGPEDAHLAPERLLDAMRYSVLSPGKRLRPTLVLAAAEAVGGRAEDALLAACALEMIHAYSLVHDDLPALDDDDTRRGRPSCHKQFDEATALLAGDALLTEAFTTLTDPRPLGDGAPIRADIQAEAVRLLARAAGAAGMVGGQQDDLTADGQTSTERLMRIHRRKTGRLIQASCAIGALFGGGDHDDVDRLSTYGAHVGLAFQLVDDILDEDGLAAIMGAATTRQQARLWTERAITQLAPYGAAASALRTIAERMVSRIA